ncbi:MAG: helix-turn-helix domain-containing protein [Candidatus Latescibacterota bacterium]
MSERDLIRKWILWKERTEGGPYTRKDLADSAGLSPTYLSSIMTGARNAGTKTIERIAGALGIPLSTFYAGPPDEIAGERGEKTRSGTEPLEQHYKAAESAPDDPRIIPRARSSFPDREQVISGETGWKLSFVSDRLFGYDLDASPAGASLSETPPPDAPDSGLPGEDIPSVSVGKGIPLLAEIPSGHWRSWSSFPGGDALIPRTLNVGEYAFSVRVEDDSMAPMLEKGMLLVVDPGEPFSRFEGGVGVIACRGKFIARRVYRRGEKIMLAPMNSAYQPEVIDAAEGIVFKVVLIIPSDSHSR